jgi:copper chaperone
VSSGTAKPLTPEFTRMETASLRDHSMEMGMLELKVEGLTCGHCVKAVTEAVHAIAPQADVAVDLTQGSVKIDAKNAAIPAEALIKAIEDEGYKVQ